MTNANYKFASVIIVINYRVTYKSEFPTSESKNELVRDVFIREKITLNTRFTNAFCSPISINIRQIKEQRTPCIFSRIIISLI